MLLQAKEYFLTKLKKDDSLGTNPSYLEVTKTSFPLISMISMLAPASTSSPKVCTSTLFPQNSAVPEGRRAEIAIPF
jgi:hypothetical protein